MALNLEIRRGGVEFELHERGFNYLQWDELNERRGLVFDVQSLN
jgi:hypothetical protein